MSGFNRFKANNEAYLRQFTRRLTRAPKHVLESALKEAIHTAVTETSQDSGNAAWHWTITGFRQADVGGDPRQDFSVKYGQSPIGNKGDKGSNKAQVTTDTLESAYRKIHDMIWRQGRTAITLYNGIPDGAYGMNAGVSEELVTDITAKALEKARLAAKKQTQVFEFDNKAVIATGSNFNVVPWS